MAAASSSVQLLDLDAIESAEPDLRPQKRRKTKTIPMNAGPRGGISHSTKFDQELSQTKKKYERGKEATLDKVKDKKLRTAIQRSETQAEKAAAEAARAEILLPASTGALEAVGDLDRTWRFTQQQIGDNVDVQTQKKMFNLNLDQFGPYMMDYTRSGRHLLLGGAKGHIALFNPTTFRLQTELHLRETVRDIKFLHNTNMFAVAQKQYAYIYDGHGVELHCLRNHVEPTKLEFLPYHFLLVSASKTGFLKYTDVSTGQLVCELRSRLGPCDTLRQNPRNAIMLAGHGNGLVTMWSPNMTTPLIKMQCHRGPVNALAVDLMGQYFATAGMDGQVKIWDTRTYKMMHSYYSARPASALDISQQGLLAVGYGPHIQVWKDALITKQQSPYLVHHIPGQEITDLQFCPYEDVLGFSHSNGFSSIVVPGAGEANFDSYEVDLFASRKQRQESEVRQLLDKLQPEMITLDTDYIGRVDRASKQELEAERKEAASAAANKFAKAASASSSSSSASSSTPEEDAKKARSRARSARKLRRKRANIVDAESKERREEALKKKVLEQEQRLQTQKLQEKQRSQSVGGQPRSALARFLQ